MNAPEYLRLQTPKLITAAALILLSSSCQKPTVAVQPAEEVPAVPAPAIPTPAVIPVPSAPVASVEAVEPPAPAVAEPASPARWFLRRKASIETADGIVGLPPGTEVEHISADQYRVPSGDTITLADAEVTNVVSEARALVSNERAGQAAVSRLLSAQPVVAPAAAPEPAVTASQPVEPARYSSKREYVPGVRTTAAGLQSSTALGAVHSKTSDGWVWQKSPDGKYWMPIKQLDKRRLQPAPRPVN